jgi:membrane peptidoglycan carboxypeptidase
VDATVASLNVPFFDLTQKLGVGNVIEMAAKAGVDYMWANAPDQPAPVRTDLRGKPGAQLAPTFSTEVGIGQYGITVLDHSNGLATLAAGGKRAQAHFVRSVEHDGDRVYAEDLRQTDIGLAPEQIDDLNATLNKVTAGNFSKDWDAAGKTGTWQAGNSTEENAHTWMVGYTRAIAAAVWVGTTDGAALKTKNGRFDVYGYNYPGPIWQQFMAAVTKAMDFPKDLARFRKPKVTAAPTTPAPPPSVPTGTATAGPTGRVPTPTLPPLPPITAGPPATPQPTKKPPTKPAPSTGPVILPPRPNN